MEVARQFDCKKIMRDGQVYDNEPSSKEQAQKYAVAGFEVQTINEENKYYIFTRRVVTGVSV